MAIKIGFVDDLCVDSEKIRDFYSQNWNRKIALSDEKFYEWQFLLPPRNCGKDHCVIAYDDLDKKVLGVMGLNERLFFLRNEACKGAELTTWMISNELVGKGLGARILHFIQSNFEVLIGMGISDMALPIYMRSGFRYLRSIPRFVRVVNFEKVEEYSLCDKLAKKLVSAWSHIDVSDYEVQGFDKSLFHKVASSLRGYNHFSRESIDLEWRYSNHPYFEYRQFLINKPGEGEFSYVCLRGEDSLDEFRVLHLMDCFGDESSMESAFSFVNDYAKKNNYDVIDFYCTSSAIYRFALGGGWFSIADDSFLFPHLFHPVEMRTPPTTSLIYWAKNQLLSLADVSRLYVTKQDADLDRPTMHTLEQLKCLV